MVDEALAALGCCDDAWGESRDVSEALGSEVHSAEWSAAMALRMLRAAIGKAPGVSSSSSYVSSSKSCDASGVSGELSWWADFWTMFVPETVAEAVEVLVRCSEFAALSAAFRACGVDLEAELSSGRDDLVELSRLLSRVAAS